MHKLYFTSKPSINKYNNPIFQHNPYPTSKQTFQLRKKKLHFLTTLPELWTKSNTLGTKALHTIAQSKMI